MPIIPLILGQWQFLVQLCVGFNKFVDGNIILLVSCLFPFSLNGTTDTNLLLKNRNIIGLFFYFNLPRLLNFFFLPSKALNQDPHLILMLLFKSIEFLLMLLFDFNNFVSLCSFSWELVFGDWHILLWGGLFKDGFNGWWSWFLGHMWKIMFNVHKSFFIWS